MSPAKIKSTISRFELMYSTSKLRVHTRILLIFLQLVSLFFSQNYPCSQVSYLPPFYSYIFFSINNLLLISIYSGPVVMEKESVYLLGIARTISRFVLRFSTSKLRVYRRVLLILLIFCPLFFRRNDS